MEITLNEKTKKYLKANGYNKVYLSRGLNKSIYMFPESEWNYQYDKFSSSHSDEHTKLFFSNKDEKIDLEENGFKTIPIADSLKKWAEIKKDVAIMTAGRKIEIWSKERWDKYKLGLWVKIN